MSSPAAPGSDTVVQGSKLTRVLVDSGNGLNLIFASTLAKMGLNYMSLLTPSKAPFYGIVPGNSSTPIGSVTLPVTFGIEQNFRTEYIKFEVVDFKSSYHSIFGRPALAKFMAVPHYVYLLLKMCNTRFIKGSSKKIIYVPGSSHTYIQQNKQYITSHIT